MNHSIKQYLDKGKLNFVSPYGFGDTVVLCNCLSTLEKKYGDINLVIKPSHTVVAEIFGINSFTVMRDFVPAHFDMLAKQYPQPDVGAPFIAHPNYSKNGDKLVAAFLDGSISFKRMYEMFFEIDVGDITVPAYNYQLSTTAKCIIDVLNIKLNQVALIAPEATSIKMLKKSFWASIVADCLKRGLTPVCTVCNLKNIIPGSLYIPLSIRDMLSIVDQCAEIHSLRSGFCDLIALKDKKMTIYYPDDKTMRYALLKDVFKNTRAVEVSVK